MSQNSSDEEERKIHNKRKRDAYDSFSESSSGEEELDEIDLDDTEMERVVEVDSFRSTHRKNLRRLLKKMLLNQNWVEASGVLSVLLKGSAKETSISRNRYKYWAAMELIMMHAKKGNNLNQRKILNIYDTWMSKLRRLENEPTSMIDAQLEFILYCLRHGNLKKDAYQGVLSVMQERDFEFNPFANLVVGLAFYELWYSAIPEDMQLRELISPSCSTPMESQMSEMNQSVEGQDGKVSQECESSNTSVGNEKKNNQESFYLNEESPFPNHSDDDIPTASIFYTRGLPPWLLPLKLPDSTEDVENFLYRHRNLKNANYRNAIKHLRVALHSEPPMLEAFHPLIQILLLGDEVKEALVEIENFSQNSDTALHSRIKASVTEYFDDQENMVFKLSTYLENILKKDPTCSYTLSKLVRMHQSGEYNTEGLVEMIALHLDATFADWKTWKELASCLLKVSLSSCLEDEMSTCCLDREEHGRTLIMHSNDDYQIPAIFRNPETECNWRLRCKWWLTRHFGQKKLESDIASSEMQLVTYKAAVATHLYGREVKYVAKVIEYLKRENNSEMLCILQKHLQNSVGFYFSPGMKNS